MHNINELMAHNEDNRIFQKKTTMDEGKGTEGKGTGKGTG
jgi:hypothetical protein